MRIDINLIPLALLEAQSRRRHIRGWAAAIAPALVLLVVICGLNWFRQSRAGQLAAVSEELATQLDGARSEVRRLTAAVNETSLQLERAEALRSKRSWSGLMGLLAKARPDDVWFSTLTTDPAAPAAGKAAPIRRAADPAKTTQTSAVTIDAPRKLRISGYSASAAGPLALVSNLKAENVFSHVALERALSEADEKMSRFQFDVVVEW